VLRMTRCVFSCRIMSRGTRGALGSSSSSWSPDASNDPGTATPLSSKSAQGLGTLIFRVPTPLSFHPASLESRANSLARNCSRVASPDSPSSIWTRKRIRVDSTPGELWPLTGWTLTFRYFRFLLLIRGRLFTLFIRIGICVTPLVFAALILITFWSAKGSGRLANWSTRLTRSSETRELRS
jgi:hypothetical protein